MKTIYARADSGFYCAEAVEAYEKAGVRFIVSARKTVAPDRRTEGGQWTGSPKTDADGQCEFRYQPEGWSQAHRFIALRYIKKKSERHRRRSPNSISCSTRRSTAIAYSSPI